jgi:hypothetical protein
MTGTLYRFRLANVIRFVRYLPLLRRLICRLNAWNLRRQVAKTAPNAIHEPNREQAANRNGRKGSVS